MRPRIQGRMAGGVAFVGGGVSHMLDPAVRDPIARAWMQAMKTPS